MWSRTKTPVIQAVSLFFVLMTALPRAWAQTPPAMSADDFGSFRFFSLQNRLLTQIPWEAKDLRNGLRAAKQKPGQVYFTIHSDLERKQLATLLEHGEPTRVPLMEYLGFADVDEDGLPTENEIKLWLSDLSELDAKLDHQSLYVLVPVRGESAYQVYFLDRTAQLDRIREVIKGAGERWIPEEFTLSTQSSVQSGALVPNLKSSEHFLYRGMRPGSPRAQPIFELVQPEDLFADDFLDELNSIKKITQQTGVVIQWGVSDAVTAETRLLAEASDQLPQVVMAYLTDCNSAFENRAR